MAVIRAARPRTLRSRFRAVRSGLPFRSPQCRRAAEFRVHRRPLACARARWPQSIRPMRPIRRQLRAPGRCPGARSRVRRRRPVDPRLRLRRPPSCRRRPAVSLARPLPRDSPFRPAADANSQGTRRHDYQVGSGCRGRTRPPPGLRPALRAGSDHQRRRSFPRRCSARWLRSFPPVARGRPCAVHRRPGPESPSLARPYPIPPGHDAPDPADAWPVRYPPVTHAATGA